MMATLRPILLTALLTLLGIHSVSAQEFGFVAANQNMLGTTNQGVTGAAPTSLPPLPGVFPGLLTVPGFLNTAGNQSRGLQANGLATMNTVGVAVGDFNSDGIPDIVALSSDDTNADFIPDTTRLTIFLGVGDGTFGLPLVFQLAEKGGTPILSSTPTGLAVADIDLDGVSDLVIAVRVLDANRVDASRVLLVNGKSLMGTPPGAFLSALNFNANVGLAGLTGTPAAVAVGRLTTGQTAYIAVGLAGTPGAILLIIRDSMCQCFTGPGVSTAVVSTLGSLIDARRAANEAAAIGSMRTLASAQSLFNAPLPQPAPRPEYADVLVATSAGIEVFENNLAVNGGFSPVATLQAGTLPVGVVVADVNRDNSPDVIALDRGSSTVSTFLASVLLRGYSPPIISRVGAIFSTSLEQFNFNNDGFPDLVVANSGGLTFGFGDISVLTGNGAGSFTLTKVFNSAAGLPILNPSSVATGKFDLRSVTDDIVVAELGFPLAFLADPGGAIFVSAAANYNVVPTPTQPASSTVVTSTPNPSSLGQPVVFTATVIASTGPAAGVVSFNDGGISIGTATLDSSGKATFTTSSLAQGSHKITATFFHNSNFGGCISAVLTQTVQPAVGALGDTQPPTTIASLSPQPNAAAWNNTDVTVMLAATDELGGSGVKQITYSAAGAQTIASTTASTASASFPITTEGVTTITFFAIDNAGNVEVPKTITIKLDKTPPSATLSVATGTLGNNGWYISNVTVHTAGADSVSNPVNCTPDQFLTTDIAGQIFSGSCTNAAGLTTNATPLVVKLDKTPPTITLTTPAKGAVYLLNQAVASSYGCTDNLSGVATCAGPVPSGANLDAATVGTKNFVVNAGDTAGNTAAATTSYSVQYNFVGFLQPVQNLPTINVGHASRTYPVKWQLLDANGAFVSDLSSFTSLVSAPFACDASPSAILAEEVATTGGTSLRYDPTTNQFIFNWQTSSSWTGCRLLQLTLADGTQHVAKFNFQ